jgi:hypothetical protein
VLDVNVWRLATVAGVEEESKRPDSQHSRHGPMLGKPALTGNAVPDRVPSDSLRPPRPVDSF